jgi:hypothetical protein
MTGKGTNQKTIRNLIYFFFDFLLPPDSASSFNDTKINKKIFDQISKGKKSFGGIFTKVRISITQPEKRA